MESHGAEWHSTFQRTMCMPQPRLHAVNPRHPGLRSGMSRTRHQQHPLILDELRLDQSYTKQRLLLCLSQNASRAPYFRIRIRYSSARNVHCVYIDFGKNFS
jgi:hypothetical protein